MKLAEAVLQRLNRLEESDVQRKRRAYTAE